MGRSRLSEDNIYDLAMEVCRVRDKLQVILDGTIPRSICPAPGVDDYRCGGTTGYRKVNLNDARTIAKYAIPRLEAAVNKSLAMEIEADRNIQELKDSHSRLLVNLKLAISHMRCSDLGAYSPMTETISDSEEAIEKAEKLNK